MGNIHIMSHNMHMSKKGDLTKNRKIKPPLKWAGGKRWLVPYLMPIWESHKKRRLVEPFCGGLAAALGLMPETALLNDVNPHLINFYNQLKRGLTVDIPMRNEASVYYKNRDRFNALLKAGKEETKNAAELFYYLNRTGFNGLCRFNNSGFFNIPFGRYKTINYTKDFTEYKNHLKDWKFIATDFENIKLSPDDFIYADPPYDVQFTQYSMGGFSWEDQIRAAEWLAKHPGPVVLSNQATDRIIKLYSSLGFKITVLDAPRIISCTGDRKKVKEVLATKGV